MAFFIVIVTDGRDEAHGVPGAVFGLDLGLVTRPFRAIALADIPGGEVEVLTIPSPNIGEQGDTAFQHRDACHVTDDIGDGARVVLMQTVTIRFLDEPPLERNGQKLLLRIIPEFGERPRRCRQPFVLIASPKENDPVGSPCSSKTNR